MSSERQQTTGRRGPLQQHVGERGRRVAWTRTLAASALAASAWAAWAVLGPAPAPTQVISTFAGGGAGDGQSALLASIDSPTAVTADADGNVYIADQENARVRKVSANGVITTIAGNGVSGFAGDGGAAVSAMLGGPGGLAFDANGSLFIADALGGRIRKINRSGVISTVAGNGDVGFGGDGGPALQAAFAYPERVAVGADGTLYVADNGNHRIRRIGTDGVVTTIAGTGSTGYSGDGGMATAAQLSSPHGVAVDASGNVLIADSSNHRIRRIDSSGHISTFAGTGTAGFSGDGGPASAAQFDNPYDIGFDADGNLLVADATNARIRRIDADGMIATVAGNGGVVAAAHGGPAAATPIGFSEGVGFGASGELYIAASASDVVIAVDAQGNATTLAGNGAGGYCCDGAAATASPLPQPVGIAVAPNGDVFLADRTSHRVRRVSATGSMTTAAGNGSTTFSGDGQRAAAASLFSPTDVATDAAGNLYIADTGHHRIRKVNAVGVISTFAGNGNDGYDGDGADALSATLGDPESIAVGAQGSVYVADRAHHVIRRIDAIGRISTIAGIGTSGFAGDGGPATQAALNTPAQLAFDASSGALYVADSGNHRIRRIDADGTISSVAGSTAGSGGNGGQALDAQFNFPAGIALDGLGNLYIADTSNHEVRKVDANGVVSTSVGTRVAGFAGDGGAPLQAQLHQPERVAIDTHGNLLIADTLNRRVRIVGTGHRVGGSVSGLVGTQVFLALDAGPQTLAVSSNGLFTFPNALASGTSYEVTVQSQPFLPAQTCSIENARGTITDADVSNVLVTCVIDNAHTVTSVAGPGGSIDPSGPQQVADGFGTSFVVTPDPGHVIESVTGCGVGEVKNVYATDAITADCTVVATFAPADVPVNGTCGSDNGKTLANAPVNLCSAGTPSGLVGTGPWTWTCAGLGGGSDASCAAQKASVSTTSLALSLTPNPALVNETVHAQVQISGVDSGAVTIAGGGKTCVSQIANAMAACTLVFATPGSVAITATYAGDTTHTASTDTRTLVVTAAASVDGVRPAPALDRWAQVLLPLALTALAARRRRPS